MRVWRSQTREPHGIASHRIARNHRPALHHQQSTTGPTASLPEDKQTRSRLAELQPGSQQGKGKESEIRKKERASTDSNRTGRARARDRGREREGERKGGRQRRSTQHMSGYNHIHTFHSP